MATNQLPENLTSKGCSPTFTEQTIPQALLREHALGAGRWAVLQILEGTVVFVDLVEGEEKEIVAPGKHTVKPESPHRLRLQEGSLRCQLEFFEESK